MHRLLAPAAFAAVSVMLAAAPAAAQEARVASAETYRTVNMADMTTLLNGMGFATVKKAEDKRFDIESATGFKFSVELTVCDVEDEPPGCLGVLLFATWGLEPADEAKIRQAVERFNTEYRIGKALVLPDSVYAERYVTTDGGVPLRHIGEEIGEFEAAMAALSDLMFEAVGE